MQEALGVPSQAARGSFIRSQAKMHGSSLYCRPVTLFCRVAMACAGRAHFLALLGLGFDERRVTTSLLYLL